MAKTREYLVVTDDDKIYRRCYATNRAQAARLLNYGKEHGDLYALSEMCYTLETRRDYDRRAKY